MNLASQRQRDAEIMGPNLTSMQRQMKDAIDNVSGHAHNSDIDRYLQAKREAAQEIEATWAEEEEPIPVEEETEISRANIARMQEIAAAHQGRYSKMMSYIRENDPEHAEKVLAKKSAAKRGDAPFPTDGVQLTGSGRDNPERLLNACKVANELVQRKSRQDKFQRRRRSCLNEEVKKIDALQKRHEEADKRTVLRQKELVEKQAEKTAVAQQKAGEQQKALKDLQKFQDLQFEKLQLKHHAEAVSTQKGGNHDKAVSSTPPPSRPSTGASLEAQEEPKSPTAEQVYRRQVQSHKKYKNTLEKWNTYVRDNERRTEAHWVKMVGDKRKSSNRVSILRKHVQGMSGVLKFLGSTRRSSGALEMAADMQEFQESLQRSPSRGNSPSSPKSYQERLERARSHQDFLQKQALEKRDRDTAALENKNKKRKEELRQISERAKHHNHAWEQKNAETSSKRDMLNSKSDTEIMQKLARQKKEREEKEARKDEEMESLKSMRNLHISNVKANAKMQLESMTHSFKEKQNAKEERLAESMAYLREAALESPTAAHDFHQVAKGKIAIKSASEQAFSANTMKAIEMKKERVEKMKLQVLKPKSPMEAFGRQRVLLKEKSSKGLRIPPPELTLTPGWDAVHEDLGLAEMESSMQSLQSLRSAASSGSLNRPSSPAASPKGGESSRSQNSEMDADELEAEFLSELQSRSAVWLADLREKEAS